MELDKLIELFGECTDADYLKTHYPRFCLTRELAYKGWKWEKADILDVGAHWLHQSVLYALDGHHVTATDFSVTLNDPGVRKTAAQFNIDLFEYDDLSSERVFDGLDDNSMDVILFCEILEHITFNPVNMWKAFYRVLRPGGRIIITTPNFYSAKNIFSATWRFLSGQGSGISVQEILNKHTHSPHWKEFSRKELRNYFRSLSADFELNNQHYISYISGPLRLNWKGMLAYDSANFIPIFRNGIYLEIDLPRKDSGITVTPGW